MLLFVPGDRYGAQWTREAFARCGVTYRDAIITRRGEDKPSYLDRSSAYLEVESLFAQGTITLLDHPKMVRELRNLERRPIQGGRDRIDHPLRGHDDCANALALAAAMARQGSITPCAGAVNRGSGALGAGNQQLTNLRARYGTN